jgi:predicted aconitase with swiveling domain
MKFGPGLCAIALTFQLTLPALALPVVTGGTVGEIALNNAANQATAPIQTIELRATPLLIGHCTIWHRAHPQQKNAISG